jgi:DNA-binding transcriptional LysR family regulator
MRLFHGFERFSSEVQDYARGTRGHMRLRANMSALVQFLPTIIASFLAQHPDIRCIGEEASEIARSRPV